MKSSKADKTKAKPANLEKAEAIQTPMLSIFQAGDLSEMLEGLEADGHRCEVFDDVFDALRSPNARLFLLQATEQNWPILVEALTSDCSNLQRAPVLVCFTGPLWNTREDLLAPGIDDFLLDPLNLQELRLRVTRLVEQFTRKWNEVEQTTLNLLSEFGISQFIGKSPAFLAVVKKIQRIATCDAGVLLMGETGTGKELCARSIHYLGPRAGGPFIPINCGSIPHELFENELFGHEPGAFTGASRSRRGLIAEAEGGTLFLDEVDSMPLAAQVKLLRFSQDRKYRPLGASGDRQANVRLIAATNQDLLDKVRCGAFREDLFYRLKIISLGLPPLRERAGDIVLLASHFLRTAARQYDCEVTKFSREAIQKLSSYSWPGNVRELENIICQAVVFAEGRVVRAQEIHLNVQTIPAPSREPLKVAKARLIEEFERNYLREVLCSCGGNISRAARQAQKDRRTFFALLKKYNL